MILSKIAPACPLAIASGLIIVNVLLLIVPFLARKARKSSGVRKFIVREFRTMNFRTPNSRTFPYLRHRFMKPITEIYPLLGQPKQVVITTPQKPDPDAMGYS